jgi:hypothetical protein
LEGAVHETVTAPSAAVTIRSVGASGAPTGVTAAEAVEAELVPETFVAVAVNVYALPLVRPVMVQLTAGTVIVQDLLSGDETTA